MAMRSRAASRLCQKSSMGFIYQQRELWAAEVPLVSRAQSESGWRVMRRLLNRFSSRAGMGSQRVGMVLMTVTAGPDWPGCARTIVCRISE